MKKVGVLDDGSIIILASPDEWKQISENGLEAMLNEALEYQEHEKEREAWIDCPALGILRSSGLSGIAFRLRKIFPKPFDGSIEHLRMVADGTPPLDDIPYIGPVSRKRIADALSDLKSEKGSNERTGD